jgi:uncharacterized protein
MFIAKKKFKIEKLIFEYLDIVSHCLDEYKINVDMYLQTGIAGEFSNRFHEVHSWESKADDKRKDIEFTMYKECLIPESRGDILRMLETLDKIPNAAEMILNDIFALNLTLPNECLNDFKELFNINLEAAQLVVNITYKYFESPKLIYEVHQKIDKFESSSDKLQNKMTHAIFESTKINDFQKILLREIILLIGKLSDRAEDFADYIKLLSVKTVF